MLDSKPITMLSRKDMVMFDPLCEESYITGDYVKLSDML